MVTPDGDPDATFAPPFKTPTHLPSQPDAERLITLEITHLAAGGDAFARYEGRAIFVTGGLPNELVRARVTQEHKSFARAEVVEILRPSPDRVAPPWPELGESGGFQWQYLAYPAQLRWKTQIVREQLERIGHFADPQVRPTLGMPDGADLWAYRIVMQFAVGADGAIGFLRAGSHDVIDMPDCPLAHPDLAAIYRDIRAWLRATWAERAGKVIERFSLRVGQREPGESQPEDDLVGVLTLEAGLGLDSNERQAICDGALVASQRLVGARLIDPASRRHLAFAGHDHVYERILGRTFRVSAGSFFQVNGAQSPVLLQQALDAAAIRPEERALDGYSGVGLFSLFLGERAAHVWAIESASSAVADAHVNADVNGVSNVTFLEGQVEREIDRIIQAAEHIDIALMDPPRAGSDPRVLSAIQALAPRALVYVSCDPATLARDLRLFCATGDYQLAWVQPVDMFPGAAHIECVALCERISHQGGDHV